MSADLVPGIAPIHEPSLAAVTTVATDTTGAAAVSFAGLVSQGLSGVSRRLHASEADLQRLSTGDVENLHQVMLGLEHSRLSFQLLLQVRSRLLEAYQEIMRLQV